MAVSDSGPGVDPTLRARIFEPFFTTKADGLGTGIGLAVCHGMVSGHDGRIDVHEAPGGGARFVVTLPLTPPAPRAPPRTRRAAGTPSTKSPG